MFSLIFALAILLFVLLFVGVGLLIGRRYVWIYSAAKVAALVVTASLTILLSSLAARGVGALVKMLLAKTDFVLEWDSVFEEMPLFGDAVVALVAMIIAPVLFYVIFSILRPIFYKIARIIVKKIVVAKSESASKLPTEDGALDEESAVIKEANATEEAVETETAEELVAEEKTTKTKKEEKKKKKKYFVLRTTGANPLGMVCGAVGGLLMALILLAPVVGFLTVADSAMSVATVNDNEIVETVCDVVDGAANNVSSKAVNLLGGKLIYRGLTTYSVGEAKVSLVDEAQLVGSIGDAVGAVKDRTVDRAVAAEEVRGISASFAESDLIPTVLPDFLKAAGGSWEKGNAFHGIKKPTMGGATVSKVLDPVYSLLATSDSETIKTDVDTILNVIAILVQEDVLGSVKSNPLALVNNETVTAEALRALLQNERTKPLVGSFAQIGLNLLGDKLAIRDNMDGLYDDLLDDAVEMVRQAKESEDVNGALLAGYVELMDNYGLDLTEESIDALVASTAAMESSVGEDAIKTIFANTPLALKDGRTVTLNSEEAVADASVLVFMDDLTFDSSVIGAEEIDVEAKALANVLSEMMGMMDKIKGSGFGSADTIRELGSLMNALSATKTVGKEETDRLLMGMLQSEQIHDQIGFSVLEATEVAISIGKGAAKDGYVSVLGALGNTIEIVQMSSKNENIDEKMNVLLQDLTPESATVLQTMAKPSVMTSHGVPEKSADASANMMSSMFGNLADAKESGMSEEEYEKESKAVADMTNLAMKASSSKSDKVFGEGGVLNSSAEEYVGDVFDSKVMSKTLVETVYPDETGTPVSDPLNTQKNLSESETAELMDALNKQWAGATAEEKADPEYVKTYYAIGSLMNVDSATIDTIFAA